MIKNLGENFYDPTPPNSSYLHADRRPCPVCGHPTGDCAGSSPESDIFFVTDNKYFDSLTDSQKILVEEDIYQERQISSYASIKVRLAKKGSYVTIDRARELGIVRD